MFETNADIYVALLQIRSTPISPRLSGQVTLQFNRPPRGILLKFNRQPVLCGNDNSNLIVHLEKQPKAS